MHSSVWMASTTTLTERHWVHHGLHNVDRRHGAIELPSVTTDNKFMTLWRSETTACPCDGAVLTGASTRPTATAL